MKIATLEKPLSNSWANAQRYSADFYDSRYPICGKYLVYAVVGRKWVRVTQGDLVSPSSDLRSHLSRFKMSIHEWNNMRKEKFNDTTRVARRNRKSIGKK